MAGINLLAVVVATVAVFVTSSVWYSLFGREMMTLRGVNQNDATDTAKIPAWQIPVELVRSLVVAFVLAVFFLQLGIDNWIGAVQLGFLMWVGFPVTLLIGSVIWENVPWKLAAIHIGDWFVKLLLMAAILGVWR